MRKGIRLDDSEGLSNGREVVLVELPVGKQLTFHHKHLSASLLHNEGRSGMGDFVLKAQGKLKFFHKATSPDLASPWHAYHYSFSQCPG